MSSPITDAMVEKAQQAFIAKGYGDIRAALESAAPEIRRAAMEEAAKSLETRAANYKERAAAIDHKQWPNVRFGLLQTAADLQQAAAAIRALAEKDAAT